MTLVASQPTQDLQASAQPPSNNILQPQDLQLEPAEMEILQQDVKRELSAAILAHEGRQKLLARWLKAYKAIPDQEVKNFPWPNASNVVIPIVAITVDTVASRLHRAVLGAKEPCEAHIRTNTPFMMNVPPDPTASPTDPPTNPFQPLDDKAVRDWVSWLFDNGFSDKLRTVFSDMPLYGDAFVSPIWTEVTNKYHAYDPTGAVVEVTVPGYTGTQLSVYPPDCVFWPTGYEEWPQLPWFSIRLRYSLPELMTLVGQGVFKLEDVQKLVAKQRDDRRRKVETTTEKVQDLPGEIYELYEIRGLWCMPSLNSQTGQVPQYEEVVLTYSKDADVMMRAIYNPYFGKARHFVKVPYLVQPHEIVGMGVAEMALPFQHEASTSHNQVIDAATAANAGITIVSTRVNLSANEEIHPGKTVFTDGNPKDDLAVVHLADASPILGQVEDKAFFMNEKRTGVSVYNLGMESPQVGSRATATGTTALINEGNMRFWVSIDDMRKAIEELLYLTIQQEQQMRPGGYYYAKGKYIQFPQGDPRQSIGLRLRLSSESVNRDIEVQQMQLLIQVLNDYYMRLNQAVMLLFNPQFPPQAKMMALQVMEASSKIIKKFVERFDVENLDEVVPSIMQALQQMGGMMQSQMNGPGQIPPPQPGAAPAGPGRLPSGPGQAPIPPPGGGRVQ